MCDLGLDPYIEILLVFTFAIKNITSEIWVRSVDLITSLYQC